MNIRGRGVHSLIGLMLILFVVDGQCIYDAGQEEGACLLGENPFGDSAKYIKPLAKTLPDKCKCPLKEKGKEVPNIVDHIKAIAALYNEQDFTMRPEEYVGFSENTTWETKTVPQGLTVEEYKLPSTTLALSGPITQIKRNKKLVYHNDSKKWMIGNTGDHIGGTERGKKCCANSIADWLSKEGKGDDPFQGIKNLIRTKKITDEEASDFFAVMYLRSREFYEKLSPKDIAGDRSYIDFSKTNVSYFQARQKFIASFSSITQDEKGPSRGVDPQTIHSYKILTGGIVPGADEEEEKKHINREIKILQNAAIIGIRIHIIAHYYQAFLTGPAWREVPELDNMGKLPVIWYKVEVPKDVFQDKKRLSQWLESYVSRYILPRYPSPMYYFPNDRQQWLEKARRGVDSLRELSLNPISSTSTDPKIKIEGKEVAPMDNDGKLSEADQDALVKFLKANYRLPPLPQPEK